MMVYDMYFILELAEHGLDANLPKRRSTLHGSCSDDDFATLSLNAIQALDLVYNWGPA